jgi:CheY-like chemotaxis protein
MTAYLRRRVNAAGKPAALEVEPVSSSREAIRRLQDSERPFDLLIASVEVDRTGEVGGKDLPTEFSTRHPGASIIITTDQPRAELRVDAALSLRNAHFLPKPVTFAALEEKLLVVLHPKRVPARTVLLVEDDVDVRDALIELLAAEGFSTVSMRSGERALEYLSGANPAPSVILLDLMMPGMSGVEFRRRQLSIAARAAVPVVVISANPKMYELTQALAVQGFVAKPMDVEHLLDTLHRCTHV